MSWSESSLIHRLFSHRITFAVFILTCFVLVVATATYLESRDRRDVSLSGMRLAAWSLTQLRDEARSFDRQLVLADTRHGNPSMLTVRYEILWSRFEYLLDSKEASVMRRFNNNEEKIEQLFLRFQDLDVTISRIAEDGLNDRLLGVVKADWRQIYTRVNELVIENMVGGETGNLTEQFDEDLNKLTILRTALLALLVGMFVYFLFAIAFLRKQFLQDPLTGLPNRHYFERMGNITERDLCLVFVIKKFQDIQTEHGGEKTDGLIVSCANRLKECITSSDVLIHLSYGEFLIIKRDHQGSVNSLISDLLIRSSFDWETNHTSVPIHFYVGADQGQPHNGKNRSATTRHQNALRALNEAALNNKDFRVSNHELLSRFDFRAEVLGELVHFFRGQPNKIQLSVVYQPIVRTDNNKTVVGAEVLLRAKLWGDTPVPPNVIVDICESHGLGTDFGHWLFTRVGHEASQLFSVLRFEGFLSINLNPALINEDLPDLLQRTIIAAGVKPNRLCLEITEDNASLDFDRTMPVIEKLQAMGTSFALDDFGTGYSSLEYLHRLRIDKLKIDRYFVNNIEFKPEKSQFLKGILEIAHQMGVDTVVEGIENQRQWDVVEQHDATMIQGYFAYKPMEFSDFLSVLIDQLMQDERPSPPAKISQLHG